MTSVQRTGSLRICHVNVRSLSAESRLFDMELMSASKNNCAFLKHGSSQLTHVLWLLCRDFNPLYVPIESMVKAEVWLYTSVTV